MGEKIFPELKIKVFEEADLEWLDFELAYKKLLTTELYALLQDSETRLFLETNEYLQEACDKELDKGIDALYDYINN